MKLPSCCLLLLLTLCMACQQPVEHKALQPNSTAAVVTANRQLIEQYHEEVWVKKNVEFSSIAMSDSFFSHSSQAGTPKGPGAVIQFLHSFYKAFPDLHDTKTHLIVDGHYAVLGWEVSGTMKDSLWGMPPTNKQFTVAGNDILKIENGQFTEHWFGLSQVMGSIFQQCGIGFPN